MDKPRTLTQPIKWHGGKHYLAPWIIEQFPDHKHYVEPYFGGGSVLLRKPAPLVEGHSEVVNDIHSELVNFWRVLQSEDRFGRFGRRVQAVAMAEEEWRDAAEFDLRNGLDSAVAFFIRARQSRQGLMKDFATLSRNRTRRGMNEQASAWITAVDGLPEIHARLRRVVILCRDALGVIRQQDGEHTLFYMDPPYLHETRQATGAYHHEMSEEDHSDLLRLLSRIKGKFILSGYDSNLYHGHAMEAGWRFLIRPIDNKASSKQTKEIKHECLWMNF